MAVLKVVQGSCPGQLVELQGERMVMGRHPSCHIVLDNAAVSRNHAQILESHGSYFLEDLRSRNGTLLNGERIRGRIQLRDGDELNVCDVLFTFHLGVPPGSSIFPPPPAPVSTSATSPITQTVTAAVPPVRASRSTAAHSVMSDFSTDGSSILSSLDLAGSASHLRIGVRPEAKLRAVLEISTNLANMLDVEQVLPRILESLFKIFPQADRGFAVLKDPATEELSIKAILTRNGDQVGSSRPSSTILNEAMQSGCALLSADAAHDGRFERSDSVASMKIRSLMCAPLVTRSGRPLGAIQLDTLSIRQQFSQDDLDVLASVAAQAALAVENATLHASAMKQRDLERELEFATQVQLGFLPTERPRLDGYQFFDYYEAAYRVGGDFFDYVPLADGRVAVSLGDVAGKGIPAALLMARLYSAARYELLTKPTTAEAITSLNAGISSSGLGHRFITFVCVIIDPRTHELVFVNAGHMPPLLRSVDGKVRRVAMDDAGLPLAVMPDTTYRETRLTMQPGEKLILFTDGVTEAMNPDNDLYGQERLVAVLESVEGDIETLGSAIVEDVETFCRERAQRDDICLICFGRAP